VGIAQALAQGIGEQEFIHRFQHVAVDADVQGLTQVADFGGRAHHHDLGVGIGFFDGPSHFQAIHDRHDDVGDHDVGAPAMPYPQSLGAIGSRADLRRVLAGNLLQLDEQDGIVLHHQNVGIGQSQCFRRMIRHGASSGLRMLTLSTIWMLV
jgi:hypothetical protein